MGEQLRTFSGALRRWAFGNAVVTFLTLLGGYVIYSQTQPAFLDAIGAALLVLALIFGLAAFVGVVLNVLRLLGWIGFLDSAELRHEACVDCHHDYAMPKQKDRDVEEPFPGDVYRVEVKNRIRVSIPKVTLVIDEADPPIDGLQVRATLMNDRHVDFPESNNGVTVAPGKCRHWTVAVMYDEGPDAKKPFLTTVNGPRPLNVGQSYRISLHAESNGEPIAYGAFQVFYTQQTHLRFHKVASGVRRAAP